MERSSPKGVPAAWLWLIRAASWIVPASTPPGLAGETRSRNPALVALPGGARRQHHRSPAAGARALLGSLRRRSRRTLPRRRDRRLAAAHGSWPAVSVRGPGGGAGHRPGRDRVPFLHPNRLPASAVPGAGPAGGLLPGPLSLRLVGGPSPLRGTVAQGKQDADRFGRLSHRDLRLEPSRFEKLESGRRGGDARFLPACWDRRPGWGAHSGRRTTPRRPRWS